MTEKCGNCKFYKKENPIQGLCLRFPPQAVLLPGQAPTASLRMEPSVTINFFFPAMKEVGWCGEWRMKLEAMQ